MLGIWVAVLICQMWLCGQREASAFGFLGNRVLRRKFLLLGSPVPAQPGPRLLSFVSASVQNNTRALLLLASRSP